MDITLFLGAGASGGYTMLGSLWALEMNGLYPKVTHYIGLEVGSIISMLLSIDYTSSVLIADAIETKFINDIPSISLDILKNGAITSLDSLREHLKLRVRSKLGFIPTFKQHYMITENKLTVYVTDTTEKKLVAMNHETHPDISIIDAVIWSNSIPLLNTSIVQGIPKYINPIITNPYPIKDYMDSNQLIAITIKRQVSLIETLVYLPIEAHYNTIKENLKLIVVGETGNVIQYDTIKAMKDKFEHNSKLNDYELERSSNSMNNELEQSSNSSLILEIEHKDGNMSHVMADAYQNTIKRINDTKNK